MIGKRRNPIGQTENDTWLAFHPLSGVPPPISKYRIPFLLSVNKTLEDILRNTIDCVNECLLNVNVCYRR